MAMHTMHRTACTHTRNNAAVRHANGKLLRRQRVQEREAHGPVHHRHRPRRTDEEQGLVGQPRAVSSGTHLHDKCIPRMRPIRRLHTTFETYTSAPHSADAYAACESTQPTRRKR